MNTERASALLHALPLAFLGLVRPSAYASEAPVDVSATPTLEQAMICYERCDWDRAYAALAALAEAGNPEGARMALLMRAHGSRLFGHVFEASPAQRAHWLEVASRARALQ
jgi:hypothetical protein